MVSPIISVFATVLYVYEKADGSEGPKIFPVKYIKRENIFLASPMTCTDRCLTFYTYLEDKRTDSDTSNLPNRSS